MIYQTITIPGQTIVKKNSQRIIRRGKFPSIRPSEAYDDYQEESIAYLTKYYKSYKLEYPVYAHYKFYRRTKHKFDLGNLGEGPSDILQKVGLIKDDDCKHYIPVFHSEYAGVHIDKENPRVVIILTDADYKLVSEKPFELNGQ